MVIREFIVARRNVFSALCAKHNVRELYTFGSSICDTFDLSSSDIDLLVEVEEKEPLLKGQILLDLWDALEEFFERKVDLLTSSSIKNPYLKREIDFIKVKIFDGQKLEIFD